MKIREFTPDDLPMIHGFFDQMSPEAVKFFNTNDINRNFAVKYVTERNRSIIRWLAEEDGQMIGYVFLWDIDTSLPWLGVAVREDRKRQGIGKKLVEHANQWAQENGKGGVLLITAPTNLSGQSLYESTGYEQIGVHPSGELLYLKRFMSFFDPEQEGRSPQMPKLRPSF
jgi:ribosomal protein S18 acetylase RimI-like enzyme